jgi:N-formylglutamate amidohydrolase
LLLDFHGFSSEPDHDEYDIVLGTDNRSTVFSEVDRQLFEFLESRGYRILLSSKKKIKEDENRYNGGFTICHHSHEFGINAIQIEIARHFRTKEGEKRGKKLSYDLAEFVRENFSFVV